MNRKNLITKPGAPQWIFILFLIGFIVLKIPHLSLPFFWDESGVYGKIIYELADTHLSLHPKAIDQWISRGHPLLYPNIIAAFCKIFGTNVTVAHSVNFGMACLLLLSMYRCLGKIFDPWIGFMSCALLMAVPIFYTQSVFVLPEISLTLFLWWTSWFFIQKKYFFYFLSGSAAVLIKEPAIIWIASLLIWDVWKNRKSISWKLLIWLTPLIPFCIFIYVQKLTYGWYFFPYHTGGIELKLGSISEKLTAYLEFLFWKQGRAIWLMIILFVVTRFVFKKIKWTPEKIHPPSGERYLSVLFAGVVYLLFCSTVFYGERYVLPVFPLVISLTSYLAFQYVVRKNYLFALLFAAVMGVISFQFMNSEKFNYDNDMSYIRSIASSKKTIRYMLDRNMLVQDEFSATMPIIFALADARFGYLPKDTLARYSRALHEGSKYAVQVIPGTPIENPENRPLKILDEWYDRDIITRIYQVMPPDSSLIKK